MLEEPDYKLLKALKSGMQNFVITDPRLPDNPIVYASQGFLTSRVTPWSRCWVATAASFRAPTRT